jgi:ABC-type nitrate/sulfonate/bicarbonate transport system substrate-binding protein
MIAPMSSGQLDIGVAGIGPGLFNAVARGLGLRVVAGAGTNAEGRAVYFVARKALVDSGKLNDYADLKGMTFASSSPVSQAQIVYEKALERGGLTLNDVQIVTLGFADMVPALGNGAIDLAYLIEPFAVRAVESGVGVRWRPASDVYPNYVAQVWMYAQHVADERPEVGRRFMVALVRGMRDYEDAVERNRDRSTVVAAIIKHTAIKDPALYEKMVYVKIPASGEVDVHSLQEDLAWFQAKGAVQDAPDLARVVDTRFTDYAVQRLGAYR